MKETAILADLPITLESLILLVESGLGILPALQAVGPQKANSRPVNRIFQLVHDLSSRGMPISEAFEHASSCCSHRVLRNVLLQLDVSSGEGGALVPSLRSLAHYAHVEWKMSVETRVRRLENMVVFPVFGAVIGLMLLTAAVPLIPIFELKEKLEQQSINHAHSLLGS